MHTKTTLGYGMREIYIPLRNAWRSGDPELRRPGVMTNGKLEGLLHISSPRGFFCMVATDQRGSLRRMLNPRNPASVSDEQIKRTKLSLIKNLAGKRSDGKATGVLVDPEYSFERSFLGACDIRADVGLLMGVESTGYGGQGEFAPRVKMFNGLEVDEAVQRVKLRGAAAVKMLIYHRVDSPTHKYQESAVKAVGEACEKHDIAFLLEPMSHSLEGGPNKKTDPATFAKTKPDLVVKTAAELTKPEYAVDVLKAEFPLDLKYAEELGQDPVEACRRLDEVSETPWVVLSAGVGFPEFSENVRYAAESGASGFLGGRAIWQEAVGRKDIDEFLATTGVSRLNELAGIVRETARPWYMKYVGSLSDVEVVRGE